MDVEKVIKGLEWVINDIEENGHYQIEYYAEEIRNAIALLKKHGPGWISVKDRLPPKDDTKVLTYGNPVTHWMPLPEPPKEV